jgi:hypothetical protein
LAIVRLLFAYHKKQSKSARSIAGFISKLIITKLTMAAINHHNVLDGAR